MKQTERTTWELPVLSAGWLVKATLAVTAVILAFWFLLRFYNLVLLLVVAIIISTALRLVVNRLDNYGVPKSVGVLAVYGLAVVLVVLLLWWSVPTLADQATAVAQTLRSVYESLREAMQNVPNILVRRLATGLPDLSGATVETLPLEGIEGAVTAVPPTPQTTTTSPVWSRVSLILEGLISVVVVFALAFYWTLEAERLKQAGLLLIPLARRDQARDLLAEVEEKLGGYVFGQVLLVLIIGVLSFAAYGLLGLPQTLLLATFAGLMEAVPIIGPFLGAVPAVIIGFSISPTKALWVIGAAVLIQQVENTLLVPRVMNRTIGVRPLVTLLALLALSSLFGFWGALVALPLAAVLHLLFDRTVQDADGQPREAAGRDRRSRLLYQTNQLVQDVRQHVRRKEGEPTAVADYWEDEVEAIALDLKRLLDEDGNEEGIKAIT